MQNRKNKEKSKGNTAQKKHAVSNENCVLFDFQMLLGKRKSVSIMRGEDSGVYRQ